jgi:hypothetical protein
MLLGQFCTAAQLYPLRVRATLERKPKYETIYTMTAFSAAPGLAGVYRGRLSIFGFRLSGRELCTINC